MTNLADAIIAEDQSQIMRAIQYGEPVNAIDQYGFTPLIEAAV